MTNWKDIHSDFTEELQEEWESFGFDYEQVEEWINFFDFSPYDVDFAAYIGDKNLIISEMTKKDLTKLRKEYNEAVESKEMTFPFKEGIEEEKKEEIISSRERDWRNIHRDFSPELTWWWQECGFSYEEARDWINIGIGIDDVEFCAWLRNVKKLNAEGVLNYENVEQLKNEYQQCSSVTQIMVPPSI